MTAIIMNTLTYAVTEYSNFDFDGITPTHAGSAAGLFALGGNLDVAAKIVATVKTPRKDWGSSLKKAVDLVFLSIKGNGTAKFTVQGEDDATQYSYDFPLLASGESRAKPGRGIRENSMAFGLTTPSGQDFQLDRIEVNVTPSTQRRTK